MNGDNDPDRIDDIGDGFGVLIGEARRKFERVTDANAGQDGCPNPTVIHYDGYAYRMTKQPDVDAINAGLPPPSRHRIEKRVNSDGDSVSTASTDSERE